MGSDRIVDLLAWRTRDVDHRIEIVERADGVFTSLWKRVGLGVCLALGAVLGVTMDALLLFRVVP